MFLCCCHVLYQKWKERTPTLLSRNVEVARCSSVVASDQKLRLEMVTKPYILKFDKSFVFLWITYLHVPHLNHQLMFHYPPAPGTGLVSTSTHWGRDSWAQPYPQEEPTGDCHLCLGRPITIPVPLIPATYVVNSMWFYIGPESLSRMTDFMLTLLVLKEALFCDAYCVVCTSPNPSAIARAHDPAV